MEQASAVGKPSESRTRRRPVHLPWLALWRIIFAVLISGGLVGFAAFVFSPHWTASGSELPVGLRSPLQADYRADPLDFSLPPVKSKIIQEALVDQASQADGGPDSQMATIVVQLLSPVPTVTPQAFSTPWPTLTLWPSPQFTSTLHLTRPVEQVIPSPTGTGEWTATVTPTSTVTFTATPTQVPATATRYPTAFHPTATRQPAPTNTFPPGPVPASPTPAGTAAPAQTATQTAVPAATSTPTAPPLPPTEPPTPPPPGYPPPPGPTATPENEAPYPYPASSSFSPGFALLP